MNTIDQTKIQFPPLKRWLPLYDVFRHFKKELFINFSEIQKSFNNLILIENQMSWFVFMS